MCGIFGIVTDQETNLGSLLIEAGRRLSYRGYDSVGCATIDSTGLVDLRKDVGKIDDVSGRLLFNEMTGTRGIVQLRWATFGHPSTANAQPHIDSDGDLVGAHNGNVVNNVELRHQFIAEGMTVRSTNDGESCVHAVERYIDRGYGFIDAIRMAYEDLAGDYSFVIGQVGDDHLYAVKKGSGLVVGIGEDFSCVSSDMPSILPLTRSIYRVYDGEIVALAADKVEFYDLYTGNRIERDLEIVAESMESVQKGGYPHFMLKEIYEQPAVAQQIISLLEESADIPIILEAIKSARNIYLVGCGTSYHACLLGSVYLNQIAKIAAIPVLAPQFISQYGMSANNKDVGFFVSQSGETKDVLNAIKIAGMRDLRTFGVTNVIGSTITQVSESFLPLACGYEISVPATKTFISECIVFLYLATRIAGTPTKHLYALPELLQSTLASTAETVSSLVPKLKQVNDLYSLGYGATYPIALEGALKLKEITYAHCEGMLSTEFKHGPLSAVIENYPVIYTAVDTDIDVIVSGINEVTCRGGYAITIGPDDYRLRNNANYQITLPESVSIFQPILEILPLQLLSYQLSVARGIDPDFPRNLSKTLTVD